jgi:hypothetical protein
MLTRLILFFIRLKLGVKKFQKFQFTNQKADYDKYYFNELGLQKIEYDKYAVAYVRPANVSLMWLLNDDCKIKKVD